MPLPLKIKRKKKIRGIYSTIVYHDLKTKETRMKEVEMFTVSRCEWGFNLLTEGEVNITHLPSGLLLHHFYYDEEQDMGGFFHSKEKQKRITEAEDFIRMLDDNIFPPFLENHYALYFLEKGVHNFFPEPTRRMKRLDPLYQTWKEQVRKCLPGHNLSQSKSTPDQWDDDIPF